MDSKRCYFPVLLFLLLLLLVLPLFASADGTTVSYEGTDYPQDAEYIDLGNFVVKDFDAFTAFLDQMPALKQVDMWKNRMTAAQCDMLAARYPGMRWGWTMVIRNRDHEHIIRPAFSDRHEGLEDPALVLAQEMRDLYAVRGRRVCIAVAGVFDFFLLQQPLDVCFFFFF